MYDLQARHTAHNVIKCSTPVLEGAALEAVDEEILVEDLVDVAEGRVEVVSVVDVRAVV